MKRLLIILACLFLLTGCGQSSENNNETEKLTAEMEYISSQIADMLHSLNNISLENYELVSEKVTISQSSSEGESGSGGSSKPSSGQGSSSSSQSSGSSGGGQGSQGGEEQSISVTEMQNNSVLKVDTEDIDWDTIKELIDNINTSWSIIMLDLSTSNVSNDDIAAFGNLLDNTIISIKNEDKDKTLINLTSLYSYIPKFLTTISADKQTQNIEQTKYHIFLAYSAASMEDWESATSNLTNAENSFLEVLNNTDKNNEFKIKKTYILITDIQNSIPNNDKTLFFIKHKNLMQNLNTI